MFLRFAASLTVGAVMRTIWQPTAKVERLFHAPGGVHRVACNHGLYDDRMVATNDDAAARRIADDNFAALPPLMKKW